ncbi:hypothetical protein [Egicoccus sp. AB-alg6-2]|uniref:SCO6745 family protein n=1 Tax=Egicoccus sp. AB-alg6-2 TaxID=3242692 RepID=UPI00359E7C4E
MDDVTTALGITDDQAAAAHRAWARLEVVHAVVYFSPIVADAQARVGLEPGLMSYAAARIGPSGAVGPELAAAAFYGFSPRALAEVLPAAWDWARPDEVVHATRDAVGRTLAPFCDGLETEVRRAAELARQVAELHPTAGRPMAAARATVPWPDEPHLVLWEAATRVRESRGDGHVACLVTAAIDGIESHLLPRGDGEKLRHILSPRRGWTDPEWDAAVRRLADRGLLDGDGRPTEHGRDLHAQIERRTDALATPPWLALGAAMTAPLEAALAPLVDRLLDSGMLPGVVTRRVVR